MTRVCKTCAVEQPDSAFRKFGRGRKKICVTCEGGGYGRDRR